MEFGTHIYEVLAAQKVELHRRSGAPLIPSGIYRCNIQTVASHHFSTGNSVYVGLYPSGEGSYIPKWTLCIFILLLYCYRRCTNIR